MSRPLGKALSLALFPLLLIACGDDDSPSRSSTPTPTSTPVAAATSTPTASSTQTAAFTTTPTRTVTSTATPSATATSSPTETPTALSSEQVLARGPHGIGVTTTTFVDTNRPTMPNGVYTGTASRTLVTEIWYPTTASPDHPPEGRRDAPLDSSGAPYPLVVYSHGFMDQRRGGDFIGLHLASHGYIVAAPDFPLTNFFAPGRPTILDVPQQPGDVSFIIDRLLDDGSAFAAAIDRQRIGLTGLSLGGLTTHLATFHANLRDPRVRASAPIAGPACFFTDVFFATADVPLLVVHGDIDAIVPYEENGVHAFEEAQPPKYLVTVIGASHTAFSALGAQLPVDNPDVVGCAALAGRIPGPEEQQRLGEALGGPAVGIVPGDCPLPCEEEPPPLALRGDRQLQLTLLAVFPFFEAYLRGDDAMLRFLEQGLDPQTPEIEVQVEK